METLSCHSNGTAGAMAIKNTIFVVTNAIIISTKFQLHIPYGFREEDF